MTFKATKTYYLYSPLADAKEAADDHNWGPGRLRWKKQVEGDGHGHVVTKYYEMEAGYEIWDEPNPRAQTNPSGPYHVSVVPAPPNKFWPGDRDVLVIDEAKKGAALVRLHDLLIDPQLMLVGTKVVLQAEDERGTWVTLLEYTFKGCRRGWEKRLS